MVQARIVRSASLGWQLAKTRGICACLESKKKAVAVKGSVKQFGWLIFLAASIITVFYVHSSNDTSSTVDLVIFSYNRPLQLYALLESVDKYVKGAGQIHVIYRASDEAFAQGYALVAESFTRVHWHAQGNNPQQDFKPLTLKAAFESPSAYIIFAVDDIVVKDSVDLAACAQMLEKSQAYGFYLRLGKNLNHCYSYNSAPQAVPTLTKEADGIFSWHFNNGQYDWIYPHTVDMTVYRKKDIESDLRLFSYANPNRLEDVWNMRARAIIHKKGLCFAVSKIVNMPLNRVQHDYNNRAMAEFTPQDLLKEFISGKKMDIAPLYCVNNRGAHMEYTPTFINR